MSEQESDIEEEKYLVTKKPGLLVPANQPDSSSQLIEVGMQTHQTICLQSITLIYNFPNNYLKIL